jgi:hypothetical protein
MATVRRWGDRVVVDPQSLTADSLVEAFAAKLAETIRGFVDLVVVPFGMVKGPFAGWRSVCGREAAEVRAEVVVGPGTRLEVPPFGGVTGGAEARSGGGSGRP